MERDDSISSWTVTRDQIIRLSASLNLTSALASPTILLGFRAKAARDVDDKANQQNQAKSAAADDGATEVKPATAK